MNDHDAIEAINAVLDAWFKGKRGSIETLHQIASISGANSIDHAKAKEAQK